LSERLFAPTLWVGSMTLISRILGFLRDMLIARIFGADWMTDAFFVAFKAPNFFRRLLSEGAVSHACLPIIEDYKNRGGDFAVRSFVSKVSASLLVVSLLLGIAAVLLAPSAIVLLAPGFAWQGRTHTLATLLLQLCAPYLSCIALTALFSSVLNAYGKFAIPALVPSILNAVMILAAIWLSPSLDEPVTALAIAVSVAGLIQLLILMVPLYRLGLLSRPKIDFYETAVARFCKNLLPSIFSVSATQLNLLLDTLVASMLATGSVSWLYYSDRLVEFPLGILGITLSTVLLPRLAKCHSCDKSSDFSSVLDWSLRCVLLAGMPATVGMMLLAEPILSALFQYHEFSAHDVAMAGQSVRGYAVGLMGCLLVKVLVPGFTVREDFKTPVRFGVYAMLVSLLLNVLAWPFAHAGLALATSLGALTNAGMLLKALLKKGIYTPHSGWPAFFLRITAACLVMSAVLCANLKPELWSQQPASVRVLNLMAEIGLGMVVYALVLAAVGLRFSHLQLRKHGD